FFFSSRRRHTRSKRDWSSDVCSSDLPGGGTAWRQAAAGGQRALGHLPVPAGRRERQIPDQDPAHRLRRALLRDESRRAERQKERSEERRVGKEGRTRGGSQDARRERR